MKDACVWRSHTASAEVVLGYKTSHHELNELKAHLVLRQEPEGPTGFIEGGGADSLSSRGKRVL